MCLIAPVRADELFARRPFALGSLFAWNRRCGTIYRDELRVCVIWGTVPVSSVHFAGKRDISAGRSTPTQGPGSPGRDDAGHAGTASAHQLPESASVWGCCLSRGTRTSRLLWGSHW